MAKQTRRWVRWGVGAGAFGVVCLTAFAMGCRADLRPDELRSIERPSEDAEARGRALMARAAQVHGVDAFRAHRTYTMKVRVESQGLAGRILNPWPESVIEANLSYRIESYDARVEFLSGSQKGHVWGLQSWRSYKTGPGEAPTFEDDSNTKLVLPAIQYLNELAFRNHDGSILVALEPVEVQGRAYDRVFMTWESLEPADTHDQYLFYLNAESGRLEIAEYTIRDIASSVTGVTQFEGFEDFDGVLLPRARTITFSKDDSTDEWVQRTTILGVTWDDPGVEAFEVDDALPTLGDEKLAVQ